MKQNINLSQQVCIDKSTPDETQTNFLIGDVVVLKQLNTLCVMDLITLIRFDGQYWETDHRICRIHEDALRIATTEELKNKQRLDDQVTQYVMEAS